MEPSVKTAKSFRPRSQNTPKSTQKHQTKLVYDTYLQSLAPSGRSGMASLLNRCAKYLNGTSGAAYPWHTLTYTNVAKVRAQLLTDGYAINTVNMAMAALKGLAQVAFNMGFTDADNLARIRAVKRVTGDAGRRGRSLGKEEVRALIKASQRQSTPAKRARDKALVLVACGAGLRAQELVSLKVGDYVAETGEIIVNRGKGRKFRTLHVAKRVTTALNAWVKLRGPGAGALFCKVSKGGQVDPQPLTKAGVANILDTLRESAHVAQFTPHDLRRTFITQLLEKGVDINTVRQLAGHSDISTTARYDCRGEQAKILASRGFSCW